MRAESFLGDTAKAVSREWKSMTSGFWRLGDEKNKIIICCG